MEQTNQKLREAIQKLEDAINHYEDLLLVIEEQAPEESNIRRIKSLKVRISERKQILDPATHFEDSTTSNDIGSNVNVPSGHDVTLFYKRSPIQAAITYQSKPVTPKPWLSYIFYKR
ncbi:hypothetical protein [Halalkalibacter okhensis]|uniref:Uncharacterized protein n=1 Tax=Halalkalibacter okhensis TaxID=333138 RepID=A0A0B0IAA8_9BACI|nr:hypothetical protein [Halalkalibacter okhensis]KHF37772.1 hypothetical protein LQ50_25510 [Halalkalibacter okhensis]